MIMVPMVSTIHSSSGLELQGGYHMLATILITRGPSYTIPNYIKSSRKSLLEFTNHVNGLQDSRISYQNFYAQNFDFFVY